MLRKPLLTLAFLFTAAAAYSQDTYYYERYNVDTNSLYNFNTVLTAGSEQIAMGSNDQLSNVANLPFTWKFFGKDVTQYKVSDNGYLTFDVNAGGSENMNGTLPDTMFAPRNAIFGFWDDLWTHAFSDGQYASAVKTYTWGMTPNRVHVIQWAQVSPKGVTPSAANGGWMDFAIRIYESGGFDIIHNSNGLGTTYKVSGTIGAQSADGKQSIQVVGSPNIGNPGGVVYRFYTGEQPTFDVEGVSLNMYNYVDVINGSNITLNVHNLGKTAITSADFNYSVDGKTTTKTITGLNIEPNGGYATITFPDVWKPTAGGKTVKFSAWLSNLNGSNADVNTSNDAVNRDIYVSNKLSARKVLIEEQTSATCDPCAIRNPGFNQMLSENMDKIVDIKYQVWWPAPGNDPMYLQNTGDVRNRIAYYNYGYAPTAIVDGTIIGDPIYVNADMIDAYAARPAPFSISATADRNQNDFTFNVNVTSNINTTINDTFITYVAVIEDHVGFSTPASTNGETDFYQVMRKMLPSASGTKLSTMTEGTTKQLQMTWALDPDKYKADELRLAVWVQNKHTHEVQQAFWTGKGLISGIEVAKNNIITGLYPNPATSITTVEFKLDKASDVTANLMDITGRQIMNITSGQMQAGAHAVQMDVSKLAKGVYYINMNADGNVYTQKLIVQ
jgi:hypothetical protein